ncbi:MAG TPA: hypothetical protein VHZ54_03960, partial [Solirubrobacterales bacterium]|nr:hypothetical protein [Solirubrobacterales bacterium]
MQARHVDELVAHPHLRVEAALLRHVADAPPRLGVDRRVVPQHPAGIGGEDAEDDPHQRRLAGAVGTDEAEHLARPDREGDAVQRHRLAIFLAQLIEAEDRFTHRPPTIRPQRAGNFFPTDATSGDTLHRHQGPVSRIQGPKNPGAGEPS